MAAIKRAARGFSVAELMVVLVIVGILTVISIPYLYSYKTLYKSEEQAVKIMDLMREASQLAMNRRRTMRFEIDMNDRAMLLIDENAGNPDTLVKSIPLDGEVRVDAIPGGVTRPDPPKYNDAVFANDSLGHMRGAATVTGHKVWQARFRSDGSVVNAAGLPVSANLYVWPPSNTVPELARSNTEVRAITMFGGSGAVRYWRHDGTKFRTY